MKTRSSGAIIAVVALTALPSLVPRAARADETIADTETRRSARERYAEGVRLYRAGNFAEALREFTAAYRGTSNWRVLYNIAQVEAQLHDYAAAMRSFERYLGDGAAEVEAARVAEVTAEIERMTALVATLEVRSGTPGVRVFLDDIDVGPAPLSLAVNVGPRTVRISAPGFVSASDRVLLSPGERKSVSHELAPAPRVEAPTKIIVRDRPATPAGWITVRWAFGLSTAAFAAGAAAAGALSVGRDGALGDALERQPADPVRIDRLRDQVQTTSLVADVFLVASVVSLTGFIVSLIGPFESRSRPAAGNAFFQSVHVFAAPSGAFLELRTP